MNRKKRTQRLTLAAFFVAIEIVLGVTPLGFIPVGAISITTMHLPVILAGMVLGPGYGAMTGFVFGMISMIRATMSPGLTSFCFSPFITVGGVSGNFWSFVIALGPRMFLGWFSGVMFRMLKKHTNDIAAASVTAAANTLIHTLLVMGLIWVFFGTEYASAAGISVGAVIVAVLASNGILEIILAAVAIPALVRALKPSIERMEFYV
ncbi:MAG: ECF transporter S component [Bulleidia sp.]|nr:ECF transporter S component [Bulleidia sp.]